MSGWGQAHINNTIGFGGGVSCGGFTGLLDDYPGGILGLSVRQLRALYVGNDLEAREDALNAQQDFGFVDNELDTASLLSFTGSNSGFIPTLYDQSSSAANAIQPTASNQPRIVNSGVLDTINSKPALYFDGVNDALYSWNNTTAPLPFQTLGNNLTFLTRCEISAFSAGSSFWFAGNVICDIRQNILSTPSVPFSIGVDSSNTLQVGFSFGSTSNAERFASTQTLSINTPYYFGVTVNNNVVKMFINGSLDSTHTLTTASGDKSVSTTASTLVIGSRSRDGGAIDRNPFSGKINELAIWNVTLSDADIIAAMNNSIL